MLWVESCCKLQVGEAMRCLWCGIMYDEQFSDIAMGFCSNKCACLWKERIEHSHYKNKDMEDMEFAESLKRM